MLTRRAGMRHHHIQSNPGDARHSDVASLFFYDCDEAITPPMHRFNKMLALAAIPQSATRSPQPLGEGGFTQCLVRP
jgi:hypothetical protein